MLLSGHGFMNTVRYISLLSIFILLFAANAVAQQEQTTDVVGYEIPLDSAVCETMHGKKDAVDTVKEQIRSVMREKDGVKVCFRIHPAGSNATIIYWNDSSGESVIGTVDADRCQWFYHRRIVLSCKSRKACNQHASYLCRCFETQDRG